MAIFAYTRDKLVELCCKTLLHDWAEGVTTATGSSSTAKDTARQEVDDYWNSKNAYIYIRDGDYATTWAKVTDFAVSAGVGTITFAPAAGGTIASGVSYSLHTEYPRDEVVDAINLAIDRVAEKALFWVIDESTITLAASTYEYDLPTNLMFLYRVTMADSDGNFYNAPIPSDQYKIIYSSTPKLHFIQMPPEMKLEGHEYERLWANSSLTAARALRLEGLGAADVLSSDSSTCPIDPNYVIYQAAALLHMSRTRSTEQDPDDHRIQGTICQGIANALKEEIVKVQLPPNAKRVRE